jgi:hypothetical protein
MKKSKSIFAVVLFVVSMFTAACSQDEHMDEIMSKVEINQPSPSGGDTSGSDNEGEDDEPSQGL